MAEPLQEKYQDVLEASKTLLRQRPDWVTFFREILGVEGLVRRTFPAFEELVAFEQSDEYRQLQLMLVQLRERRGGGSLDVDPEPTRVITVRLPKSMHEHLRTEAHDLRTSMNKLCISKLLQAISSDVVPKELAVQLASATATADSRKASKSLASSASAAS